MLGACAPMPVSIDDGGDAATIDARSSVGDSASTPDTSELDSTSPVDVATPSDSGVAQDAQATDVRSMGDSGGGANRSAGCGRAATIALNSFVARQTAVAMTMRDYYVRLPTGYDANRAYPIVYQFHGCSTAAARQDNNPPVHTSSGTNAIIVRGRAAANCWDTATTGPDIPYIDAMIADAERNFCVDTTRRFASGYSSGSFMTHRLACIRGALFRGVASIAGGQTGSMCTGNVAALLIHDTNDMTVNVSESIRARDNHVMRNGCNAMAARTPVMPMPCESYAGCMPGLPVVWCQTSGQDHSRQDSLAGPAFWSFFNGLPPR